MKNHVNKVVSTGFYQLLRLRQVRRILGQQVTANLICSFVLIRLDYCNSLFTGLHKSIIDPLQRLQNAAARLVTGIGMREHVTPALRSLHWLPVRHRVTFKLCVLMHMIHYGRCPSYLTDLVTATAELPCRGRLRSASSLQYELPRLRLKIGERSFSYAGPVAWNSLPTNIQQLADIHTFRRRLKAHLFMLAF